MNTSSQWRRWLRPAALALAVVLVAYWSTNGDMSWLQDIMEWLQDLRIVAMFLVVVLVYLLVSD